MANQASDLDIPKRPEHSEQAAPQRQGELPRFSTEQVDSLASPPGLSAYLTGFIPPHAQVSPTATDLPRAASEAAHVAALSNRPQPQSGSSDSEVDSRTLIVGPGVVFSGDLSSCDHLVIEGRVEANLHDCQNIMIGETGTFSGNGSSENADVRGRIDGEIKTRKRLMIRAGGHVTGTITYGEIEIEFGGKISGTIQTP
jgi:cytoskeletal protein CcmA (bactofilin family)